MMKTGRNETCPCGSGAKYKLCCLPGSRPSVTRPRWSKLSKMERHLTSALLTYAEKAYGPRAIADAWKEFTLHKNVAMDPKAHPEFCSTFIPWYLFNWEPECDHEKQTVNYPEAVIAQHYLVNESAPIDSLAQQLISEVCACHFSFYLIDKLDVGKSAQVTDLLVGGSFCVPKIPVSAKLQPGFILYGRVAALTEGALMIGCAPTVFPPWYSLDCDVVLEELLERVAQVTQTTLKDFELELRRMYFDLRDEVIADGTMEGDLSWAAPNNLGQVLPINSS